MESVLHAISYQLALAIQAIAIVVVTLGTVRALMHVLRLAGAPHAGRLEQRAVWLEYAHWLVAALTFQLAADIVGTSFTPTWDELGRLAIVAGLRTFLSYFLDRELQHGVALAHAARSAEPAAGKRRAAPGGEAHERYD